MRLWALAVLIGMAAAAPALAQDSSGWTIAERLLEDGSRALVLSRQQERGRAEYRVLHEWRRTAGVYGDDCHYESGGTESAVEAERLAAARERIANHIGTGPCTLDADVLDGFDPMFARLEELVRATPLPDVQAWSHDAAGYAIHRDAGVDIAIRYRVADLEGTRVGEVEVQSWQLGCENDPFHRATVPPTGDLAERIAAARRAAEAQVRAALAQCSFPHLSVERLMAGFDEAVALTEARLADYLASR